MPPKIATSRIVPDSDPLQPHCKGQTGEQGGGQMALDFNTPIAYIERIYAATREVVEEHFGQDALAADMGVSRQIMNLRLNRKQNSAGDTQRLHLDTLGHLFCDRAAMWDWLSRVNEICGAKPPQPSREPTAEEKQRILAAGLTESAKRSLEREHNLPKGSLDR